LQKNLGLDIGESESIVLTDELNGDVLIIDETKGRAVAKSMSINLTGTLGVLLKAKAQGIVEEIRPILDKMIQKDIRISSSLYEDILKKAKE
jgi:predicted nucleic acid-binding protein